MFVRTYDNVQVPVKYIVLGPLLKLLTFEESKEIATLPAVSFCA